MNEMKMRIKELEKVTNEMKRDKVQVELQLVELKYMANQLSIEK